MDKQNFKEALVKILGNTNILTRVEMVQNEKVIRPHFEQFVESFNGRIAYGNGFIVLADASDNVMSNGAILVALNTYCNGGE